MPPLIRRAVALTLAASLATIPLGCKGRQGGTPRVLVIGGKARLVDPYLAALQAPDSVLVGSVAQGLVRFDVSGQIEGALAERWNVSDDGLSYIFRIAQADWKDGQKVTAQQVARALKRALSVRSKNALKDAFGVVTDVVPMTDRVIEIRLAAPRPNLLQLLAQPEMAVIRNGGGTGPFRVADKPGPAGEIRLRRKVAALANEESRREEVLLANAEVRAAVQGFASGNADLVLGGGFGDLPYTRAVKLRRNALQFDPVAGLFGLVPLRTDGPLANTQIRQLLSQVIDRPTFVARLGVPNLAPRATVLEPGLDGVPDPVRPAWLAVPIADRRAALLAEIDRLLGPDEKPPIRVLLPDGPGADMLFAELQRDWGLLGFAVERAERRGQADFALVDAVAPSTSPAWFLRQFRCAATPVCDPAVDTLLDAARQSLAPAERGALLAQAARQIDDDQLFIPLAAPVRWSLVSPRILGFAGNRFGRHTLTDLEQKPE